MRASELINFIQKKCRDDDPEIEFFSYEKEDGYDGLVQHDRFFENIRRKNGVIQIEVSR